MKFEDALAQIDGAQSAGGQLIVIRGGKHVLVGKHVQGTLIVEDTNEARLVMAEVTAVAVAPAPEPAPPEPEPATHTIQVEDSVKTSDKVSGRRGR